MPPSLRPFQANLERDCYAAWDAGAINVMPVAATGSGKTVVMSKLLQDEPGASVAIAHRQELVSQISIALARNGVRHRVVGAKKGSSLVRLITALQVAELGYSYLDPTAHCGVGGIDTIIRMSNDPWFQQVRRGAMDEGHHVLAANKWGRGVSMFPNARWIFPTATPQRADGKGLGRHADGLVDALVLAPSMRDIIDMGYLTDYRYVGAETKDLNLKNVDISPSTGDLNQDQLRKAVHASRTIVGDTVETYLKWTPGMLGITFCVDAEECLKTATAFRAKGVSAEVVTWKTPDSLRNSIMQRFARREILQLINVDMFGEGVDVPAMEVVSFARPTDSFNLYAQQWGRPMRLMIPEHLKASWDTLGNEGRKKAIAGSSKPKAWILDHVGNMLRHGGPPDKEREWTLDRRERRGSKKSDAIPIRICTECLQAFERVHKLCPYCGFYPEPAARSGPDFVDGDLTELDAAALAALRGNIKRIDGDFHAPQGLEKYAAMGARKQHAARQEGQRSLRNAIAWWGGSEAARGYGESESYRRFYFRFGVDVANAQLLGSREALELADKIHRDLGKIGIDGTVNAELYFADKP